MAVERQRGSAPAVAWLHFGDFADDSARKRARELPKPSWTMAARPVSMPLDMAERRSPRSCGASFSLLESGGRPVVRSVERSWWPAETLVGIRPLFERDVGAEGGLAAFG